MASRRNGYEIPSSVKPPTNKYASVDSGLKKHTFQSNILDKAHEYAHYADEKLSELGGPIKPYLPLIGRFLVVVTYFEDSWRIVTNWSAQVQYIWKFKGISWVLTELFFISNVFFMIAGSLLVLTKKRLEFGVGFLIASIVSQCLIYGLFNLQFFARNVSLVGGLMIIISDVFVRERRRMPGLPEMDSKDTSQRFILIGRLLIIVLFVSYLLRTEWTLGAILLNIPSVASCLLLLVGYKARISASILASLLLVQNFMANSYWRFESYNPARDVKRYEFFQVLSVVGGLILLVNIGAGKISLDEKRKIY